MRIGELSRVTGVSIPTIRLYEREQLISPACRTQGRLREFNNEQRLRLDFIKRVRTLGFSLDEVKVLLALSDSVLSEDKMLHIEILSGIRNRKRDLQNLEERLLSAVAGSQPFEGLASAFQQKTNIF
jgi:DNA-binding transcriptional MerR regulator